jgi:haloacid dehalogenase superfamily, subfamily IA, variant 1 with third motif having Dx(3-4)D or Dx(3-4)E
MRFDAVAFDLDGTLYANSSLYSIALPRMLRLAGPFLAFNAARQSLRSAALARPSSAYAIADGSAFHAAEAKIVAERLGIGEEEARAMIERVFYGEVEALFARVRPYGGVVPALDALASAGMRLALLSDLPPKRKLELMGLSGRFELELCSEDSGCLKPSSEPFAMLASKLGLRPERVLYVGNSRKIDILGAKAAGMSAALVSRRSYLGADLAFYDWKELVAFALG